MKTYIKLYDLLKLKLKSSKFFNYILLGIASLKATFCLTQNINFHYNDGSYESYSLEDVRKITFSSDVMNLHLWDGSVYEWNVSTIGYCEYDGPLLNSEEWLNHANDWKVNIFPNPTSSKFIIRFDLLQEDEISIKLFNLMGETVFSQDIGQKGIGKHQELFDISDIPPGKYTCSISGQKNRISKLLIKQ